MIINPSSIIEKSIITNVFNVEEQVQQNGIDITLKTISKLDESDTNTLLLDQRYHCARELVDIDGTINDVEFDNAIILAPGIYDVEFNEQINIPNGMMAQIFTRSTVNRGGNFITAGLYDAGYKGVLGAILHINIPLAIEKNVRLAQIVFSEAQAGKVYEGIYNTKTVA